MCIINKVALAEINEADMVGPSITDSEYSMIYDALESSIERSLKKRNKCLKEFNEMYYRHGGMWFETYKMILKSIRMKNRSSIKKAVKRFNKLDEVFKVAYVDYFKIFLEESPIIKKVIIEDRTRHYSERDFDCVVKVEFSIV